MHNAAKIVAVCIGLIAATATGWAQYPSQALQAKGINAGAIAQLRLREAQYA